MRTLLSLDLLDQVRPLKYNPRLKVGERVYIFDIDGEYYDICVENNGNYIDLTGDDAVYADPTKIETPLMDELITNGLKQTEIDKAIFLMPNVIRNPLRTQSVPSGYSAEFGTVVIK